MSEKHSSASKSKLLGTVLLILALFGFFVFIYRLCCYHYEYDPQYSPVDYGKYNILSYFTVQSNFFAYVYFLCAALSIFGVKKAEKIGFNPYIGALVTVYVLVAGITYCAGIPMGLTPPFKWDTPAHSMSSFIQVYYHMIMPPAALIVWFFPVYRPCNRQKMLLAVGNLSACLFDFFNSARKIFRPYILSVSVLQS
ncbi:MAG: hypothetical protein ACLS87_06225 [Acutalibacteraceae bacterium]